MSPLLRFRSRTSVPRALAAVLGLTLLLLSTLEAEARGFRQGPRKRPRVREGGYQIKNFPQCEWNGPVRRFLPQRTQLRFIPPHMTDMECGNGSWGEILHFSYVDGLSQGEPFVVLSRMDDMGNVATFTGIGGFDQVSFDMAFSPPSWREGEEIFLTVWPSDPFNPSSRIHTFSPDGSQGVQASFFPNTRVGSSAVDPTGALGGDFLYGVGAELFRQDAGGGTTVFAPVSTLGDMRFGPGGAWGDDLYLDGQVVAPDGASTPFPADFFEFDWAFGDGFGGDMFAVDGSQVLRIRPDGTTSVFMTGIEGPIAFCDGALWLGGPRGCWRVTRR